MKQFDNELLGTRIRIAREQKGLSQSELAEIVGKDQRVISAIERGVRGLDVTELPAIASALDVSLMYFFRDLSSSELDSEMLSYFHLLPNEEIQRIAIDILRILAKVTL